MPTAVEEVLELSPPARTILADMEVRRRGCFNKVVLWRFKFFSSVKMSEARLDKFWKDQPMKYDYKEELRL